MTRLNLVSNGTAKDSQRVLARAVLALLVGMLATLVALSGGPLTSTVTAQETPSPSPEGPEIHFINPSGYGAFDVISDQDMEQHGYHISAAVSELPPNPTMQFELERSDVQRTIGNGTFVPPDMFEIHWTLPEPSEVPEGSHTLRAILFSGEEEVSRAERAVFVERNTATARLDYPTTNGAPLGLHIPTGEDQRWHVSIDFTYSSGTNVVRFFYSRAPEGTELDETWQGCGFRRVSGALGGVSAPASERFLCTLAEGDDGRDVKAVAVLANETPDAPVGVTLGPNNDFDAGGDAHRVVSYRQIPDRVSIAIEDNKHQYNPGECTNQFLVFVLDQELRLVPRANVDVHATGPEETGGRSGVLFNTVTTGAGASDGNQPPDQNHNPDDEQAAWNCTGGEPGGTQGNHRNPTGADTRHIESVAAGTNLDGRFRFRLRSDETGGTQITAWADIDDDDFFCSEEPSASTSVGWGVPAPTVVGHSPERTECPVPEPTTSPTPQPSPDPEAVRVDRIIGLRPLRVVNNRLQARGRVRAGGRTRCARQVPVRIQRRVGDRWRILRRTRTNARRFYGARFPDRPGRYRAVAPRVTDESPAGEELICRRAISRVRRR